MGDEIVIKNIEIVLGNGLFQVDFKNENTGECSRCFIMPEKLFEMIAKAYKKSE